MLLLLPLLPLLLLIRLQHLPLLSQAMPAVPVLVIVRGNLDSHANPNHNNLDFHRFIQLFGHSPMIPGVAIIATDHRAAVVLLVAARADPNLVTL